MNELNKSTTTKSNVSSSNTTEFQKQEKNRRRLLEEKLLINLILKNPKNLFSEDIKNLFTSSIITKTLSELEKYIATDKKFDLKEFEDLLPDELKQNFSEIILENSEPEEVPLIVKELTTLDLKQQLEVLGDKIKNSEDNENLLKEFTILSKKLSTL